MTTLAFVSQAITPLGIPINEVPSERLVSGEHATIEVEGTEQVQRSVKDYWQHYNVIITLHTPGVRDDTRLTELVARARRLITASGNSTYRPVLHSVNVQFIDLEANDRQADISFVLRERVDYAQSAG